jgi:hypothetical protein
MPAPRPNTRSRHHRIPCQQGKYQGICTFEAAPAVPDCESDSISNPLDAIPDAPEQGKFFAEQGILVQVQELMGISSTLESISPDRSSG